jgi:hypothetical protein
MRLLVDSEYIVLFWALGERVPHPWLRTVIFWLPAAFILLPWGWGVGGAPVLVPGLSPRRYTKR